MNLSGSKNLKYFVVLNLIGIIFLFSGCIDQINLTLEDDQEFLVVDGDFSTNKTPHLLKLYYATGQRVVAQRQVTGARITLMEDNNPLGEFEEINPGIYQLNQLESNGTVGMSYHIELALASGAKYQSIPEIMPARINGDSILFDFEYRDILNPAGIVRKPYVEIFVATPLPQTTEPFWIKWEVNTIYSFPEVMWSPFAVPQICYINGTETEQEVNLLNGADIEATYLPKWKVGELLLPTSDFEFRGKHYFLVNQQSITQNAYVYWSKINQIANQTGSIFDAPPAAIPGNIYSVDDPEEMVLGYFELSNSDVVRGFLTEGGLNEFYKFQTNVCEDIANPFANNTTRACCSCGIIDNGTYERPAWW